MLDNLEPIRRFADQIQREIAIEQGVKTSALSTMSVGSVDATSERSMNSSFLDLSMTVANELKDLICP